MSLLYILAKIGDVALAVGLHVFKPEKIQLVKINNQF